MQIANSRSFPAGDVFRARLILALAGGQSYQVEGRTATRHTSVEFVSFLTDLVRPPAACCDER